MPIVTPVPIPPAPPAPQRNDPTTFEERNDAAVEYQFDVLPGAIDQQSEATHQNALEAKSQAQAATDAKTAAANSATAASNSATQAGQHKDAAASSATSASDSAGAAQGAADQTALDRQATAADRVQTGEDRQAVAVMLESIEDGPVTSVNTKTGVVTLNKSDIGLPNVDNTSDADKPVSIAQASALGGKANTDLSNVSQADARAKVGTGTMAYRNVTISNADPSGSGADGDIHLKVE